MVPCYPTTPKKWAITVACFVGGAALFAIGARLSYINVAPQQARIKARNDFIREKLEQRQKAREDFKRERLKKGQGKN